MNKKSYCDEEMSQATEKEDLEADVAKHSSKLETAVARSVFLNGEISALQPQLQCIGNVADDLVVQVLQIPQVHIVEKTVEILVVTQRQNHMVQTVQMHMETPQLPCIDKVVDVIVATQQVVHVPQERVVEKIVEIPQLQNVGEIVRDTQTFDSLGMAPVRQGVQAEIGEVVEIRAPFSTESASPVFVTTPVLEVPPIVVDVTVPRVVKELVEVSNVFSQDRVQQRFGEQTIETLATSFAEKIIKMPVTRTQEKTHVVNTHVQHGVNTVKVKKPGIIG